MNVSANGVRLNVIELGNGPLTLIFMHYFGGSSLEWQGVMNQLSGQYRCMAVDLRGCGDSESTESGYSVDGMADDIAGLIDALNIEKFVLVGHSMSGKTAFALASRQPPGLQSLVLISPSPPVPEPIPDNERQKLLMGYGKQSAAQQTLKNITDTPVSQAIQEQIIADDLRTSKPAWDAWLMAGSKEDISARMPFVTVPVHIIVGSSDRALPPHVQRELVMPHFQNTTLTIVDGPGHLLPWEIPDELAAFIAKKMAG